MMAFMTHPEHGANNVPDHEIASHEANGWKVDTFDNWLAQKYGKKVDADADPAVAEEQEAAKPVRNKPGRKPRAR